MPSGILPAMITPFKENGEIDTYVLRKLIQHELAGGVHGIFAVGTTGEFYTLTNKQYSEILEVTMSEVAGRVPVYAGTNAISTRDCIEKAQIAERIGVQAVSVLTPYFIPLKQEELYNHYKTIASNTSLPIIIYDNKPKTHLSISPETCSRLADIENIVGIKDSTAEMLHVLHILRLTKEKTFNLMMGCDALIYPALCIGAKGAVAATANVVPQLVVEIYEKFMSGDHSAALAAEMKLAPLHAAFSLGSFPAVIKEALNMIGIPVGKCAMPTGELDTEEKNKLKKILEDMEAI